MTKLTKEILDLFDERFPEVGIKRGAGESWSIDFDANINIKSFLQEVVKRVREDAKERIVGLGYGNRNSHLAIGYDHAIKDVLHILSKLNKEE